MSDLEERLWDFHNYLEWEKGYDPIGASDMLADASLWFRVNSSLAVLSNEDIYARWLVSDIYKRYYPDGN